MKLTLETETLRRLLTNPELVKAFDFLAAAKQADTTTSGCGCGRRSGVDWNQVKQSVASLDDEGRRRFKELAGASSVVVRHRKGTRVATTTF